MVNNITELELSNGDAWLLVLVIGLLSPVIFICWILKGIFVDLPRWRKSRRDNKNGKL